MLSNGTLPRLALELPVFSLFSSALASLRAGPRISQALSTLPHARERSQAVLSRLSY